MKSFSLQSPYFFKIFRIRAVLPTSLKNVTFFSFILAKKEKKRDYFSFFKKNRSICLRYSTTQWSKHNKNLLLSTTKVIRQNFQYTKRSVIHLCLNLFTLPFFMKKEETNWIHWQFQQKSEYKIIRPLLNFSRGEITCFCQYLQLPIYPDKSNQALYYSRNKIRKQILPSIQLFLNPQVENSLFQFAEWITKENFLLQYN